ncbi:Maf-like protein [Corynebacterium matruchotii]|uniref:Nucleoside triphosphate pyrophosphatase n=1 Tax=Corynebacterium matruchotii TaxID=43768 RepID=A0A8B4GTL0_9CORY|nr:Maf-like protein [Corynebacterium matruchotii]
MLHPADVDEDAIIATLTDVAPEDVVLALAHAKATMVATEHPHDVVIGADSMLLLDGELQGKPHTETEAINRWHRQRGKTAQLITGHHIIAPSTNYCAAATTTVRFAADITDADIAAYAATGEPLPCAGAFTLEALGGWFIDRIEGDPSNVIGLSLPVVRRALYHFGYDVHDFWNRRKAE